MALLDCFSWYHQIWLYKEDEEKTSFITPFSIYCYLRMLKGLKNAGPTFCRMMKAILKDQIQRNVFVYVDNIVLSSFSGNVRQYAQSTIKAQPGVMCVWCAKR
jgi:hypothetical protein